MRNIMIKNELTAISRKTPLYIAGGAVRDLLLGRKPVDIDVVVPDSSMETASAFAKKTRGALVPLDEKEGVARVVTDGFTVDFSRFRKGSSSIEEDLEKRDFSINAMAVPFSHASEMLFDERGCEHTSSRIRTLLIDPLNGAQDLAEKRLQVTGRDAFSDDPLRILRAFRFAGEYGLEFSKDTAQMIRKEGSTAASPASERLNHELTLIMKSPRAGAMFKAMKDYGILQVLIPETEEMEGVEQPGFHHLDVFEHCIAALSAMDELINDPGMKFSLPEHYMAWLSENSDRIVPLKWAALTHDFAKPRKKGMKGNRVTFYNHDTAGAEMVKALAERFRWSHRERDFTMGLVRLHMRPFHLLTPFRAGRLTRRALTRLLRETGADYPALFLLAMADSMAGCGPLKPPDLDDIIADLGMKAHEYFEEKFRPAASAPRLLTGRDVMEIFGIAPGPLVGRVLEMVEQARLEGELTNRGEARAYAETCMKKLTLV